MARLLVLVGRLVTPAVSVMSSTRWRSLEAAILDVRETGFFKAATIDLVTGRPLLGGREPFMTRGMSQACESTESSGTPNHGETRQPTFITSGVVRIETKCTKGCIMSMNTTLDRLTDCRLALQDARTAALDAVPELYGARAVRAEELAERIADIITYVDKLRFVVFGDVRASV
jgi:hypothetical protein